MASESHDHLRLEIGHVLFLDIVGYSKLLIEEQKERLNQLTAIVLATAQVRASTDEQLVRLPTGDGMALVFRQSAEEPARCALEIAEALRKHPELPVRMGIHSGPVSEVTDVSGRTNIAGAGINMAQRVMDCGDAGHILVSQHVADDLMQYRQWAPRLRDLGECEVKNGVRLHLANLYAEPLGNAAVPEKIKDFTEKSKAAVAPVAVAPVPPAKRFGWGVIAAAMVVVLLAAGAGYYFFSHRLTTAAAPEKSIAVLPFENLSEDKANAYFADGIQDEILTRLSKIADLKVISRTSTQHYKSAPENLPEIARQLGVAHILEGSVQKSGDAVRVNVQLIKAANDSHLWADTFDRKLTDIFSVESEVAKAIAEQLQAKLTGREQEVIGAKPTDNLEAYDAYLRGLAYTLQTGQSTGRSLNAQKYLKDAVRLDPKFALGWALLSTVDSNGYITGTLPPTTALRAEAEQAAETALTLQPNLGEALVAKGTYYYGCLKDYDTAVRYYQEARQFIPNSSRIPESLAFVARRRDQWEQSESYFKEAERLDPRNVSVLTQHGLSYAQLRQFPEALRKLDQVLDITPDDADTIGYKGAIALAEGDLPKAWALLAPLPISASDDLVMRIKTYGAILRRQPKEIIGQLQEILHQPDPKLSFGNAVARHLLGWAQDVDGDRVSAQENWRQAESGLEPLLKDQPNNYRLLQNLGLINIGLGNKAAALDMAQRAMAAIPVEKDAVAGPNPIEAFARVSALAGDPDRAIAALGQILSLKGTSDLFVVPLTPAVLRLDPTFDALRGDPRFQRLCEEKQP